jgi:hypothetical protein
VSAEFWASSGYRLLRRRAEGRLEVTDDWLRAYLARPELTPVEDSCAAERALHAALVETPRRPITPVALVGLRDPDARANWELFAAFRDHLLRHGTLEEAYLALFASPRVPFPPLLVDQLVHAILRGILDGCTEGLVPRAAECLFRTQKVTLQDGTVLLADEEIVEMHAAGGGMGTLGRLVAAAGATPRRVELEVLSEANGADWFARSDRFDTVLDLTFGRAGLDALCRVLERWLAHLLGLAASIQPLQRIRDERWVWHVGLDAEATAILNDLYAGAPVAEERLQRLLALFRLEIRDASMVQPALAGRPIYLGLAIDAAARLRLKPQNLLVNLPLACAS